MPGLTQADRLIRIYTPLGDDTVVPRSFQGSEEVSRLFKYQVELVSENAAITAEEIVGKRVTLAIVQADRKTERYFDGFVSHFTKMPARDRYYEYMIEFVPWLWFLTRTTDCRIYQEKTVLEVIEDVFKRFEFKDFKDQTTGSHKPWTYCVQYRETAFNFISRLMEKEGIFYFFQHIKGKHTLVLADNKSAHQQCDYQSTVRMEPATSSGFLRAEDTISRWEHHYEYGSGKWTQTDYNFETPTNKLMANESSLIRLTDISKYELYDYPGEYDNKGDGEALTKLRMEREEAAYDTVQGDGDCRSFTPGYKFTLTKHPQADQNESYTLISTTHAGHQGSFYGERDLGEARYQNTFTCIPAEVQFRPERKTAHQIVYGCQTAVVVGPSGEEIYTDSYGRVKVHFFWDRIGSLDEKDSCWIRVSQPWAGKNWGAMWIPRIGQEVVVDFLEGDPDRPLIVGRVYNEQQTVPYALPANSTQSGFLSRSSKGGGTADFNELRFEDKKGSEEVHLQAQKDLTVTVENDETTSIGHDRTDKVGNNETSTVGNDRTDKVANNETGNVGQKRDWTIGNQDNLTVGQKQSISVGQEISITAGTKITITVGASSITLTPANISIQAPLVKIN